MGVELDQESTEVVASRRRVAWEMAQLALTGATGELAFLDSISKSDLSRFLCLYHRACEEIKKIQGRIPGLTRSFPDGIESV